MIYLCLRTFTHFDALFIGLANAVILIKSDIDLYADYRYLKDTWQASQLQECLIWLMKLLKEVINK